jgi:hypothetical protein
VLGGEPHIKTRAEQVLEWLESQRRIRKLTEAEWADVARCEHAIYERNRRRALEAA